MKMNLICVFYVSLLSLGVGVFSTGFGSKNVPTTPAVVNIGAIFSLDSTIGRVAKFAMLEAVNDVNYNSSILPETKLALEIRNSNCSGFLGMVEALRFMETDVVAIIGPQSSVAAHVMSDIVNELQVPMLSFAATDPTLSSLQFPFFVRTTHSDLYQMTAIAEIVDYYDWRLVIAVYVDDDFGRNGVAALDHALADRSCKVAYKAGISPESAVKRSELLDILVKVGMSESRIVVLHVHPGIIFKVFDVANYLGMMGNGYVWIVTDSLSAILDSSYHLPVGTMDSLQGVIVLRPHTPESYEKNAFISRWNNLTGGSFGMNSYGIYAYDTVWLIARAIDAFFGEGGTISFSDDSRISSTESDLHLEAMTIFDEGKLLLKSILQSSFMGLTGPIKFNSDRSRILPAYDIINVIGTGFRRIGYWSNYSGLSTVPPERLYERPPNRSSANQRLYNVFWPGDTTAKPSGWVFPNNGKKLRIGVPDRVSFREFVSQVNGTGSTATFQGFCIDVFEAAVSLLPYALPYQFVSFGDGHQNPSYTELVRLITTGFFDAVVGDIAIVTSRTKIVDFTQPYVASGLLVVAPFRETNSGAWSFLVPFSPMMWFVTLAFFLFVGFVVWVLEHRINEEFRGSPRKQLVTVIWFSFSTYFFAHRENTMSTLGRLVLLIWLSVVLIVNSSYTASLTSILTVQKLSSPVKGIESLNKSDEPIGYQVGSFTEHYLEELGISKSRLVPLGSPEEYAMKLQQGPGNGGVAAVVDERPYVDLFLSKQCSFRIVGQEFTKSGWGFAFPRDSPLAVDLSTAILALSESGDLQRIHDKWLTVSPCSLDNMEFQSSRLRFKSFGGLFLVCGMAFLVAISIHLFRVIRKHNRSAGPPSNGDAGSSHLKCLQTLRSMLDEKAEPKSREKRARADESSHSGHSEEICDPME